MNKLYSFLFLFCSVQFLKAQVPNDCPNTALLIDKCNTAFTSTNAGATNTCTCAGDGGLNFNDIDCNLKTGHNIKGADVYYSVETDIYYYFTPADTGTWDVTIKAYSCVGSGMQFAAFQGYPDSLHTVLAGAFSGIHVPNGTSRTYRFSVTDISRGSIYFQIDGNSGTVCTIDLTVNCITCNCNLAVPLQLTDLSAETKENLTVLSWITSLESNAISFEVERSNDGRRFSAVATIPSAFTGSGTHKYSFTDRNNKSSGTTYYRIRHIDEDGSYSVSKTLAVKGERSENALFSQVYANNGELAFMSETDNSCASVQLYTISGGLVFERSCFVINKGGNTVDFPSGLEKGLYLLKLELMGSSYFKKLILH